MEFLQILQSCGWRSRGPYSRQIESDGKREFVLLADGEALLLDGVGSEQLSYTITDMGERGEHSIRDWKDSAKYLDTTLPLEEFLKKKTC